MDENAFKTALSTTQIPVLVLDQKWHRLFAVHGKPDEIKQTLIAGLFIGRRLLHQHVKRPLSTSR